MGTGVHLRVRNRLEPSGTQIRLFRISVVGPIPIAVVALVPSILRHTSLIKEVLLAADGFLGAHSLLAVGAEVEVVGGLGLVLVGVVGNCGVYPGVGHYTAVALAVGIV